MHRSIPHKLSLTLGVAAAAMLLVAATSGTMFVKATGVGVGIDTPIQELHITDLQGGNGNAAFRVEGGNVGSAFDFFVQDANDYFGVSSVTAGTAIFEAWADGRVRIRYRNHGAQAGTSACFGSSGELCQCGSCS